MNYVFRPRTVLDYDHIPRGLGHTERALKLWCCLLAMRVIQERLGEDHPLYGEFQARAIGWSSK